jgi:4-hydroxy-tetrahydrodipicolinate synthase
MHDCIFLKKQGGKALKKLEGIVGGLVAAFDKDGKLKEDALREIVNHLIEGGVAGLLTNGHISEEPSLDLDEKKKIIKILVDEANNKVPVFGGTGGNNYKQALALLKFEEDIGVDVIFVIPPCGWNLSTEQVYEYIQTIATSTDLPVSIFNAPGFCSANIDPLTYKKLIRGAHNIVATKEANQLQLAEVVSQVGDKISVFNSKDMYILETLLLGGAGCMSPLSCIAPKPAVELYEAFKSGDLKKAAEIQHKIIPIGNFILTQGLCACVKAALEMLGFPTGPPRKPLSPLSDEKKSILRSMLEELKLLKK